MTAAAAPEEVEAYLQVFREFWAPQLFEDGELDTDKVARELYDYAVLLDNVPLVYSELTCGRVSKPFTEPRAVIQVAEGCVQQLVNEEVTGALQAVLDAATADPTRPESERLVKAVRELQAQMSMFQPE